MNEHALRPANVAAATALIGGIALVALPQHAMSVVRVVIVSVAVGSALWVLAVHVPPTGWISPFRWMSPFAMGRSPRPGRRVGELDVLRSGLAARRQPIPDGPALPPAVVRALQPLIALALDLDLRLVRRPPLAPPLDPMDRHALSRARARVSPETWAVLCAAPLHRPGWLHTHRPDPPAVANAVHAVLDEIGRLTGGATYRPSSTDGSRGREHA
jgi:hypothetical protein